MKLLKAMVTALFATICVTVTAGYTDILVMMPDGKTIKKSTLADAATSADASGRTVVVTSALSAVQSNISSASIHKAWPADRVLRIEKGGSIANTMTIILNGPLEVAGLYQVFSGSGAVIFGSQSTPEIPVEWFGCKADGTTDNTAAYNKALVAAAGKTVRFSSGTYLFKSSPNPVSANGTYIRGNGKLNTQIVFKPTAANSVMFDFTASTYSPGVLYYTGLSDLRISNLSGFDYSTYTSKRKIAVRVTDVSEFEMKNVEIAGWSDDAFTSEGLYIMGREFINLTNVSIQADKPVVLDTNPNHAYLSLDSSTWNGLYLRSMYHSGPTYSAYPTFEVTGKGHIQHWNVNGLVMSGVGGGFYFTPTSMASIATGWVIKNMHYEQPATDATSTYGIKIAPGSSLVYGVGISGYTGGSMDQNNGVYMRSVIGANIRDSMYDGTKIALDINGTCDLIKLDNFIMPQATAKVHTGALKLAGGSRKGSYANYATAQYVKTTSDYKDYYVTQLTRDMATASGAQTITGFGFSPRMVMALASYSPGTKAFSIGAASDSNKGATGLDSSLTTTNPASLINVNIAAGQTYDGQVASYDADGITIGWTRTGAPTGTLVYTLIGWR